MEKELEIENGILTYLVDRSRVTVCSCKVYGSRITVPETIEGFKVEKLDKKAFLSAKALKELWLPGSLREIGDFAFAYCSSLEKLWLPGDEISMGRGVFKDCYLLSAVYPVREDGSFDAQAGMLLGAVPVKLEAD